MPLKDSKISEKWVLDTCLQNPITRPDPNDPFSFRLCPVRISYPHVFKPNPKPMNPATGERYEATFIFPDLPQVEQMMWAVLYPAWLEMCQRSFPQNPVADGWPAGLYIPFKPQAAKAASAGYGPGGYFLSTSSKNKPQVVNTAKNPIMNESEIYPGAWVLPTVNLYEFGKDSKGVKGCKFGVRSIMKIADDTPIGGAAPEDPNKAYAGVNLPPAGNIAGGFGPPGGVPGAAPGAPPMPGAPGGFAPPGMPTAPGLPGQPPSVPGAPPAAPDLAAQLRAMQG